MPLSDSVNDRRNLLAQILMQQAMQQQPMPNELYGQQPGGFTQMPLEYYDPKDHSPTSGYSPGMFESSTNPIDFADMTMGQTMNPGEFGDKSAFSSDIALSATAPSSGNLFSGGFDMFGGQHDPGDMFGGSSPNPNGPPGSFGNTAPGIPTDGFTNAPLGDYSPGNFSPTPGGYDPGYGGYGGMAGLGSDPGGGGFGGFGGAAGEGVGNDPGGSPGGVG